MPPERDDDSLTTPAARVLAAHRDRLAALVEHAESGVAGESIELKRAVSTYVDALSEDLIRLYALSERGALSRSDHLVVLPALERLRNALRFWHHRRRALRDTLHRAATVVDHGAP